MLKFLARKRVGMEGNKYLVSWTITTGIENLPEILCPSLLSLYRAIYSQQPVAGTSPAALWDRSTQCRRCRSPSCTQTARNAPLDQVLICACKHTYCYVQIKEMWEHIFNCERHCIIRQVLFSMMDIDSGS